MIANFSFVWFAVTGFAFLLALVSPGEATTAILFTDSGNTIGGSVCFASAAGDIDGDGDNDAFVTSYIGLPSVWFNMGRGYW